VVLHGTAEVCKTYCHRHALMHVFRQPLSKLAKGGLLILCVYILNLYIFLCLWLEPILRNTFYTVQCMYKCCTCTRKTSNRSPWLPLEHFTSATGLYWRPGFYLNTAICHFKLFTYIVYMIAYTLQKPSLYLPCI